jgi:Na+-transporting NADH:ubiquinone oxidoreductase subunit C
VQRSNVYIVLFAAVVCVVCALFVSTAAVALRGRQEVNQILDRQKKVLAVAGLTEADSRPTAEEVQQLFEQNIRSKIVDLSDGRYAPDIDAATYDQREAAADPELSHPAPANRAGVVRVPNYARIYEVVEGAEVTALILPIEGKGLWSTLYGFLAISPDIQTIKGITFYEHGETPGLGGEVDNPRWKAKWTGRKIFDADWKPVIRVKKGAAGSPDADPYQVDGLSGATITSRGVTNLLQFWLGENGFGPYLADLRTRGMRS